MKVRRSKIKNQERKRLNEEVLSDEEADEDDFDDFYWTGIGTLYQHVEKYVDKQCFFVGLGYFIVSLSLPFLNKCILTVFNFNYLFFILSIQMVTTIIAVDLGAVFGLIEVKALDWNDCIRCWKVSCCYALNACIGLHSIAGLNIAVIDMLKRLGPFINLMLSHHLLGTDIQFDYSTVGIYMSATGCVIGAIGDNDSHIYLYGLTVLSVLLQSFYQTEVERLNIVSSLNPFELLYINAINTAPFLLALLAFTGQYRYAFIAEAWDNPSFMVLFGVVLISGLLLNYLLFLCSIKNTAITTSMIGVSKSLV